MIYNSGFQGTDAGIILINTNNGEIINNDISENWFGITLWNSDGNIVNHNNLNENFMSIIIRESNENIGIENIFSDNQVGITIVGPSSDNLIYLNSFYRSKFCHVAYLSYSGSGNSWDNGSVGNYWRNAHVNGD